MATSCASVSFESSEEKTNGFKLMRLIIDGGTEVLRTILLSKHSSNLHAVLSCHHETLLRLKKKKIINQSQWEKLFPGPPVMPNIKEYDITLLCILLRDICGISPPSTGWNKKPVDADNSLAANITRLRLFRNKYCAHVAKTSVSEDDFGKRWRKVSAVLISLGVNSTEIERLKNEECGQEEINRIKKEWSESDRKLALKLLTIDERLAGIEKDIKCLKQDKLSDPCGELNKYLQWCDFSKEIEVFSKKCANGSREWVFEKISAWFNDAKSENRAFVISGLAGMGKSVIAAVVCERFRLQLAACHFCQFNNSKYNNPKFLLQSIAWQVSNVVPEYKEALLRKLSGKGGENVDGMNILALFSHLFKEPFSDITYCDKDFLIVIDGVDENELHGKNEFADLISDHFHELPSFIRFLITTRPEQNFARTLAELNPLVLSPNDDRNIKDIQLLFDEQLGELYPPEYLQSLVEKTEGLMLFAHFLCNCVKKSSRQLDVASLPSGIDRMYESYLKRVKIELEDLGINEEKLVLFLGVIVVAKEPLPLVFVRRCFDGQDSGSFIPKKTVRKVISCLSSFLVLENDCAKFFHKSVNDWLTEYEHEFAVDVNDAHKNLVEYCAKQIDELMRSETRFLFVDADKYALQYFLQHVICREANDTDWTKKWIEWFIGNLAIMYVCVYVDCSTTVDNLGSLISHRKFSSFSEETCNDIKGLLILLRTHNFMFRNIPQSFLNHVLNYGSEQLSRKASDLLKTNFKHLSFFGFEQKSFDDNNFLGRLQLTTQVCCFDVSSCERYVVCFYDVGEIEMFSLLTFLSLWKVEGYEVPVREAFCVMMLRCVVFHPHSECILPGRLHRVINFDGKYEPGPFACKDTPVRFKSSCFSRDNSKMATIYDYDLTVWDVETNMMIKSLRCEGILSSVMFSANGMFLATKDRRGVFQVFSTENNYSVRSTIDINPMKDVVSTWDLDSWFLATMINCDIKIVSCDRSRLLNTKRSSISYPVNAKAARTFEDIVRSKDGGFSDASRDKWFYVLRNERVLLSREYLKYIDIYQAPYLRSSIRGTILSIKLSDDGRFIYFVTDNGLHVTDLSLGLSIQSPALRFTRGDVFPVANGVLVFEDYNVAELWNHELTQRIATFPELNSTGKILSVSSELVAWVTKCEVCFLNVFSQQIVSRTQVMSDFYVCACSSKYHVLIDSGLSGSYQLLQDGKRIESFKSSAIDVGLEVLWWDSCFSPSGKTLAAVSRKRDVIVFFTLSLAKVSHSLRCEFEVMQVNTFLDEGHLLCMLEKNCLGVISVTSGDLLTCINVLFNPIFISLCRKRLLLLVSSRKKYEWRMMKVWLRRPSNVKQLEAL